MSKFSAPVAALVFSLMAVAPAIAANNDEVEVGRAVEAFRAAMVAGDGRALTALAHPSLQFGHSNGITQTRDEFVKTVVEKSEIFRSVELTDKTLRIVGDLALQRHNFNADILLDGKPLVVSLGLLETWQRQADGRWLLLARQAYNTKAPMPPMTSMTAINEAPRRAGWSKNDETEVGQAVEAFRRAMVAGDGKALNALASPQLSFGHSNGVVQTREVFVGTVVNKQEIFRDIALTRKSLRIVGDTAIQRHVFNADILLGGKPLFVALGCLEIWQRQADGRWLLTARQAYNTNPPLAARVVNAGAAPANTVANASAPPSTALAAASAGAVAAAARTAVSGQAASAYAPKRTALSHAKPTAKKAVSQAKLRHKSRHGAVRPVKARSARHLRRNQVHVARTEPTMPAAPRLIWPGDAPGQRKLLDGLSY